MKTIKELRSGHSISSYKLRRILSIERFLQMLHEDSLTLIAPQKWDDPYEKEMQAYCERNGTMSNVFGLCWSAEGRSDALWRVYSPNKLGIQFTTTLSKLANALDFDADNERLLARTIVGRVAYIPEGTNRQDYFNWPQDKTGLALGKCNFDSEFKTFSQAVSQIKRYKHAPDALDVKPLARALLIKRRAFEHEQEIRLLCFPENSLRSKVRDKSILKIKTPMAELITRIEFDPRMDDQVAEALTAFIRTKIQHLKDANIKKSSLYKKLDPTAK